MWVVTLELNTVVSTPVDMETVWPGGYREGKEGKTQTVVGP